MKMKNLAKSAKSDTVAEIANIGIAKPMKVLVVSTTRHYLPSGCPFA